jgi:hypothetical protein
MATYIAVFCLIVMVVSVPLAFFRPVWVFYLFLFFKVFESIFAGYVAAAGNLGMPRAWVPGELLWISTMLAAVMVRNPYKIKRGFLGTGLIIIVVLHIWALLFGLGLYFASALTYSRGVHFIAAVIFGLRYFTDSRKVNRFMWFCIMVITVMFFVHVVVRMGIYSPPVVEDMQGFAASSFVGERGGRSVVPLLYLAMMAIGIGRITSKTGMLPVSVWCLLVGAAGIVLTETRSTYGAAGLMAFATLVFVRGRLKTIAIGSVAALAIILSATAIGFDFLARFQSEYGLETAVSSAFTDVYGGRGMEYRTIVESYKNDFPYILTGRGIGALHTAVAGEAAQFGGQAGYYHSEYLGWLDRCGLIGLVVMLTVVFLAAWRGFVLQRSEFSLLCFYGASTFLLLMALLGEGVFHPTLSHERGASILVCFIVIMANWEYIYASTVEEEEQYYSSFSDEDLMISADTAQGGD